MDIKGVARAVNSITYQTLFKYYPKLSGMTVRPVMNRTITLLSRLFVSPHTTSKVVFLAWLAYVLSYRRLSYDQLQER